jgi:hypothetical protein
MRYKIHRQWPVAGVVLEAGTVIDTSQQFDGIVPPHDCTPLDQTTRDWLISVYPPYEGFVIAPVK